MSEVCKKHDAPLFYFCTSCSTAVCADCAMFDTSVCGIATKLWKVLTESWQHVGHTFERLNIIYKLRLTSIFEEADKMKDRLSLYNRNLGALEDTIDAVRTQKNRVGTHMPASKAPYNNLRFVPNSKHSWMESGSV